MKPKTKLLVAIGIIAAFCAGYLSGILVNYPPVEKLDLTGTFGKAEKFHKVQMTSKDIQLRTEFLKDTAQLRNMIQGLIYFSVFTREVGTNIDLSVIAFKSKGMAKQAGDGDKIKALQDYSDFIRNNNKTLQTTIAMLTGFYRNKSADFSQDVEQNLRNFGTYVNNLNEKNLVLIEGLKSMDNFMVTDKTLQAHKTEIVQLKSIRDQLLIKGIQLGGMLKHKDQVNQLISYALTSQVQQPSVKAQQEGSLGLAAQQQLAQALCGAGSMNAVIRDGSLGSIMDATSVNAAASLLYDKAGLQFFIKDQGQIGNAGALGVNALDNCYNLAYLVNGNLNVTCNNYSLENLMQLNALDGSSYGNAAEMLFSMNSLQAIFWSTSGLDQMIKSVNTQDLGSVSTNSGN